jgi:hypothetical protein
MALYLHFIVCLYGVYRDNFICTSKCHFLYTYLFKKLAREISDFSTASPSRADTFFSVTRCLPRIILSMLR